LAYLSGGVAYCLAAGAMGMSELRDMLSIVRRRRTPKETEIIIDQQGSE
jgi:hypothetical protein